MSRIAMWQPKHPASETVAIRGFARLGHFALALDVVADQAVVEVALADRHGKAHALADDAADRADLGRYRVIGDARHRYGRDRRR